MATWGFPRVSVVETLPAKEGDLGSIPGVGNIPWRREWLPTPVFLPGEFQDRGAWQALVHGVTKSFTQLSD